MDSHHNLNFLENTSLHGCKNIGNDSKSRWSRIVWFLVVAVGFGGLAYTSIDLIVAINQHNVRTVFKLNYKKKIEFPAITICSSCPYDFSKINSSKQSKEMMWAYSNWVSLMSSTAGNVSYSFKYYEYVAEQTSVVMTELFKLVRWNGNDLNVLSTFETVTTSYDGTCFIFNGQKARERNTSYITTTSGTGAGLEIITDIRQDSCNHGFYLSAGLKLYIHSIYDDYPPESPDFILSPGTYTNIRLKKIETYFLPEPYRSIRRNYCNESIHYSRSNCINDCVNKRLREECPCMPKLYEDEDVDIEDIEQNCKEPVKVYLECFTRHKVKLQKEAARGKICQCTYPCVLTEYRTDSSFSYFPNDATIQQLVDLGEAPDVENAGRNLIKFNINFKKMLVETIEHKPEYSTDQILGTVGGYLGLCLGASLISVVEVIEILIVKSCMMLKHVFSTTKTSCMMLKHVFSTTKTSKVKSFQSS